MKRLLLLLVMLVSGTAAQGEPIVKKLLRDSISIYDKEGEFVEKRPKWKLPANGAKISDFSKKGHPGIADSKGMIYLRTSEIEADGLPGPCVKTAGAARAAGTANAASEGVGSGMSQSGAACIPSER